MKTLDYPARRSTIMYFFSILLAHAMIVAGLSLLTGSAAFAKPLTITDEALRKHVFILASDSLEGRGVGERGEEKATKYVADQFKRARLIPTGTNDTWFQPFPFTRQVVPGPNCNLKLNGQTLALGTDFLVLPQSADAKLSFDTVLDLGYGIISEKGYDDYAGKEVKGKAVLIRRYAPDSTQYPHEDLSKYGSLTDKLRTAEEKGVGAVLLINPPSQDDTLPTSGATHVAPRPFPVAYLRRTTLNRLGLSLETPAFAKIEMQTELLRTRDTGRNVVATLKGVTDTLIIIGAHVDHLGFGGHGSGSLHASHDSAIHYGADDNASGTAGLIELARYFASFPLRERRYSMTFIAFSGEESGLLGSSYYVKDSAFAKQPVRFMLNMDMIGRLTGQDSGLAIFGTGTSPVFKPFFENYKATGLKLSFREPGTGPSDHTSFYHASIPVLHFFTGAHSDYHKPSDTPDKVDYRGMVSVLRVVQDVVEFVDSTSSPMPFTKTKDDNQGRMASSFSVTMGIMPDYVAEVKGLKIDGVSSGRPADKAGLKRGDIVIGLGKWPIDDINGYMSALGKFRKGDSTDVRIVRDGDTLTLPVSFK